MTQDMKRYEKLRTQEKNEDKEPKRRGRQEGNDSGPAIQARGVVGVYMQHHGNPNDPLDTLKDES